MVLKTNGCNYMLLAVLYREKERHTIFGGYSTIAIPDNADPHMHIQLYEGCVYLCLSVCGLTDLSAPKIIHHKAALTFKPKKTNYLQLQQRQQQEQHIFCLEQETPRKWLCAAKLGEICLAYFLSSRPFMVPKSTKGLSLILYTPRSRHVKLCSRSGVLAVDTVDDASGQ